jgi:hypothetical protein
MRIGGESGADGEQDGGDSDATRHPLQGGGGGFSPHKE